MSGLAWLDHVHRDRVHGTEDDRNAVENIIGYLMTNRKAHGSSKGKLKDEALPINSSSLPGGSVEVQPPDEAGSALFSAMLAQIMAEFASAQSICDANKAVKIIDNISRDAKKIARRNAALLGGR